MFETLAESTTVINASTVVEVKLLKMHYSEKQVHHLRYAVIEIILFCIGLADLRNSLDLN